MDCKNPARAFCASNRCVGCQEAGDGACTGATPVCEPGSGRCVQCTSSAQHCRSNPQAAFCVMNRCLGCQMAGPRACGGGTVCDGANGRCVECTDSAMHCRNETKAFCRDNVCVGCQAAGPRACDGARPTCDLGSGRCVECVASSDCGLAEPVCNTQAQTCGPCSSDAQCLDKPGGPGVCMTHKDGRCARNAETFYVSNQSGCGAGNAAGTAAMPLCTPQAAITELTASRRLLVIRGPAPVAGFTWTTGGAQVSVIGQDEATVAPGIDRDGIVVAGGDLYVRNVSVSGGRRMGIVARNGATLRLEQVKVMDNRRPESEIPVRPVAGGILIDGAAFDIENCLISGNGPGVDGDTFWGGIRVKAVSGNLRRLERVSVVDNLDTGVACATAISGTGVFSQNPGRGEITPDCDVRPCPSPSETCGSEF
jgi:hypothetical protein